MLVTLQEAEEYFSTRPFSEKWESLSNSEKTKFLTFASKKIEKLPFIGEKLTDDQVTLFPRLIRTPSTSFTRDYKSHYIEIKNTPEEVKWAVFEEAIAIFEYMNEERFKLREQGILSASRGGLSESYEHYKPIEELISNTAKVFLKDWLVASARL